MEAVLDKYLGKWASRKLVILVVATMLSIFGKVDSSDWTYIAIAYMFVQGWVDAKVYTDKK